MKNVDEEIKFQFELEDYIALNDQINNPNNQTFYSIEKRVIDFDVDYIFGYILQEYVIEEGAVGKSFFISVYDVEKYKKIENPRKC